MDMKTLKRELWIASRKGHAKYMTSRRRNITQSVEQCQPAGPPIQNDRPACQWVARQLTANVRQSAWNSLDCDRLHGNGPPGDCVCLFRRRYERFIRKQYALTTRPHAETDIEDHPKRLTRSSLCSAHRWRRVISAVTRDRFLSICLRARINDAEKQPSSIWPQLGEIWSDVNDDCVLGNVPIAVWRQRVEYLLPLI